VDDKALVERITQLVSEEQRLQEQPGHDPARLREVEVMLDQCYDLLRQRRAHEEFGVNPDQAQARDPETVERYWQ
jgi:hypothetical protein